MFVIERPAWWADKQKLGMLPSRPRPTKLADCSTEEADHPDVLMAGLMHHAARAAVDTDAAVATAAAAVTSGAWNVGAALEKQTPYISGCLCTKLAFKDWMEAVS